MCSQVLTFNACESKFKFVHLNKENQNGKNKKRRDLRSDDCKI